MARLAKRRRAAKDFMVVDERRVVDVSGAARRLGGRGAPKAEMATCTTWNARLHVSRHEPCFPAVKWTTTSSRSV